MPGVRAASSHPPPSVPEIGGPTLSLRTLLSDFNWADRDTGWTYITADLVPRHVGMVRHSAVAVLGEPFWNNSRAPG